MNPHPPKITTAASASRRSTIGFGSCRISERGKELVVRSVENNRLSAGPLVSEFENSIAQLHGCRFGLFCNSGTSALQMALAAMKERESWQDGDEILVPAVTFVATSNVILENRLRPVFVDVEPDYYCIDASEIERHITSRTRSIMPVHIAGLPADMPAICEIAATYNLRVLEDSAEAMFVKVGGRPVGSYSTISCFSTFVAHIVNTGVGGLCLTNDAEYHTMLRSLANHGRDSIYTRLEDDDDLGSDRFHEVVSRRFNFVRLGYSYRITEMEAALGVAELEDREANHQIRKRIAARLTEGLSGVARFVRLPVVRPGAEHAWMFYPMVVRRGVSRNELTNHLEDRGIETRQLLPLISQPFYRELFGDIEPDYPVAANLNARGFAFGSHPGMSDADVDYIVDCFHEFFREKRT